MSKEQSSAPDPPPGFIAQSIKTFVEENRRRHAQLFQLGETVVTESYARLGSLAIHKSAAREVLTSALFARSIELCEASLIVLERGMKASSHITLRAQLEALFSLAALAKDEDLVLRYVDQDKRLRRGIARKLLADRSRELEPLRGDFLPGLVDGLETEIREQEIDRLSVEELARIGGYHSWYLTHYPFHSGNVHSNARAMKEYLQFDDRGVIQSFQISIDLKEIRAHLALASLYLLKTREALSRVFGFAVDDKHRGHEAFANAVLTDSEVIGD